MVLFLLLLFYELSKTFFVWFKNELCTLKIDIDFVFLRYGKNKIKLTANEHSNNII